MTACPCEEKAAEAVFSHHYPENKWPDDATPWTRFELRRIGALARAAMGHVCDECPERKNNDV